jgi:1,4-dihydroxy-6-naphthoate synthase
MTLQIGFSPCPNDTFIFDALVNGLIETNNLKFEVQLADVETLNEWSLRQKLDISKISYAIWPLVKNNYQLLSSGGALGMGVGPLLVALPGREYSFTKQICEHEISVALPGVHTTAHFLFEYCYKNIPVRKVFMPFHLIEEAVLTGQVDAGVIIHESRFTYQQKGLLCVSDMGRLWESHTNLPIPLGGIIAHKRLSQQIVQSVDLLIRKSLEYSWKYHYPRLSQYVSEHAQEMSKDVMLQHIDLYVNEYSMDMGSQGRKAIDLIDQITDGISKQ